MEFTRPRFVSLLQSASTTSSSNLNEATHAVRKPRRLFAWKTAANTQFPQSLSDSSNTDTVYNLKPIRSSEPSLSNGSPNPNKVALTVRKPRRLFAWKTTTNTQFLKSGIDYFNADTVPDKSKLNSDPLPRTFTGRSLAVSTAAAAAASTAAAAKSRVWQTQEAAVSFTRNKQRNLRSSDLYDDIYDSGDYVYGNSWSEDSEDSDSEPNF